MAKRHHDWYKLQKDYQGWQNINPDMVVTEILQPLNLKINFDYCHYGLKDMLNTYQCVNDEIADFYIITDIELSKKPLSELFSLYRNCYNKSRVGIYIAALSYYLESDIVVPLINDAYSKTISEVFKKNLDFATRIEEYSTVIDYPIAVANSNGSMIEGANYIFVHPNIKYFLWK
jgi:hypothetical protein